MAEQPAFMKAHAKRRFLGPLIGLGVCIASACIAGGAAPGRAVEAKLAVDYFVLDREPDGRPDSLNATSPNLVAGRLPTGPLARSVIVFDLPDGISASDVASAELSLFPVHVQAPAETKVWLLHSQTFGRSKPELTPFAISSFTRLPKPFATGRAKTGRAIAYDVTEQVRDDLERDPKDARVSAFRLDLSHELSPAGTRLVFAATENEAGSPPPVLKLTLK